LTHTTRMSHFSNLKPSKDIGTAILAYQNYVQFAKKPFIKKVRHVQRHPALNVARRWITIRVHPQNAATPAQFVVKKAI